MGAVWNIHIILYNNYIEFKRTNLRIYMVIYIHMENSQPTSYEQLELRISEVLTVLKDDVALSDMILDMININKKNT